MNKLEICQAVNQKAGSQGTFESTTTLSEYQQTLVGFVDSAYLAIQNYRKNWKFMRQEVSPTIQAIDPTYTNTDIRSIRAIIYNKNNLRWVHYDRWVREDQGAAAIINQFSQRPETGIIYFNPLNADYEITVQYNRVPDTMVGDYATHIIPPHFEWLIVWKALWEMGVSLGNWDLIANYGDLYSIELGQMMREQVPTTSMNNHTFVTPVQFV